MPVLKLTKSPKIVEASAQTEAEVTVRSDHQARQLAEELETLQAQAAEERRQRAYGELISRIRDLVRLSLPAGVTIAVASRGDERLLDFEDRTAWHFPQVNGGMYAGGHPGDCEDAIASLELIREQGAGVLMLPQTAYWWLEHYPGFASYLDEHYRLVAYAENAAMVFGLTGMQENSGEDTPR